MSAARRRAIAYSAGALFAALGASMLYPVAPRIYHGARSTDWRVAEGMITASGTTSSHTSRRGRLHFPRVDDHYAVNGTQLTGTRLSYATGPAFSEEHALEQTAAYPVGRQVRVYYDPTDPSRAVLEPGIRVSSSIYAAVGILTIWAGLHTIRHPDPIAYARSRRKKAR